MRADFVLPVAHVVLMMFASLGNFSKRPGNRKTGTRADGMVAGLPDPGTSFLPKDVKEASGTLVLAFVMVTSTICPELERALEGLKEFLDGKEADPDGSWSEEGRWSYASPCKRFEASFSHNSGNPASICFTARITGPLAGSTSSKQGSLYADVSLRFDAVYTEEHEDRISGDLHGDIDISLGDIRLAENSKVSINGGNFGLGLDFNSTFITDLLPSEDGDGSEPSWITTTADIESSLLYGLSITSYTDEFPFGGKIIIEGVHKSSDVHSEFDGSSEKDSLYISMDRLVEGACFDLSVYDGKNDLQDRYEVTFDDLANRFIGL